MKNLYHKFKTLISKTYAILQIKIIKYKREILILAFLFAIVILIFYYRDLITEVVIKLLQVFSKLLDKLKNEQTSTGPNTTKTENSKNNNNVYKETQDQPTEFYCYRPEKPRDYDEDMFIIKDNWKDRLYYFFRRRRYPCIKVAGYNATTDIFKKKNSYGKVADYNTTTDIFKKKNSYGKPLSWVASKACSRAVGKSTAMTWKFGKYRNIRSKIGPIIWACNNKKKCTPFLDHLSSEESEELNRVTILKNEAGYKIMEDFNSRYAELQNKAIKFGEGVAEKYITANAKSHRTAEKLFDEGLRRGQEAANAYIIEQFKNSENNTTNTSTFNMNTSTRVRELNAERNANYINEIYIILGYKKR
jgi:hypothetical protein